MMEDTLILWTHLCPVNRNGHFYRVTTRMRFIRVIYMLKHSKSLRERYNRIVVSSFNQMQKNFGIAKTGEFLEKLGKVCAKKDYTLIILPHSNEINYYL